MNDTVELLNDNFGTFVGVLKCTVEIDSMIKTMRLYEKDELSDGEIVLMNLYGDFNYHLLQIVGYDEYEDEDIKEALNEVLWRGIDDLSNAVLNEGFNTDTTSFLFQHRADILFQELISTPDAERDFWNNIYNISKGESHD